MHLLQTGADPPLPHYGTEATGVPDQVCSKVGHLLRPNLEQNVIDFLQAPRQHESGHAELAFSSLIPTSFASVGRGISHTLRGHQSHVGQHSTVPRVDT